MKLGVLTNLYGALSLEDALDKLKPLGIEAVEIGCGGYPGKAHCDPVELLENEEKSAKFRALIAKKGLEISALSVHGNPVHPQKEIAHGYDCDFRNAVLLAEKLGVQTIVTFSGCPGDSEGSLYPNWVVCPWPEDFLKILDWQWNEKLIPYWRDAAAFAKAHGVKKIALEMHPGFCVYNPETLLRLRAAVGDIIGANLDPSHLIWQGIDPVAAIRTLGPAVHYFHAKDTRVDSYNTAVNGVLDTKHYGKESERSWIFRAVGYGHGEQYWRDIISALRLVGYDGAISIEHEDSLMSIDEGVSRAAALLSGIIMNDPKPGSMSWA